MVALAAAPATAEVAVRVSGGQVDLTATAAPLADVLDRLARQTGMKVVYEGPAPRQLVTLSLHGRTPTETVLALFEGLGVNFALVADPSGSRVQTLVVAGTATASSPVFRAREAGRPPAPATLHRPSARPRAEPGDVDPGFEEAERSPAGRAGVSPLPTGGEATDPRQATRCRADPAAANANAQVPQILPPGAGLVPTQPSSRASPPSPFMPQPQPFPPVPPGSPPRPPGQEARPGSRGPAGQPAAASRRGAGYGRVVVPDEGGRAVGKALPGPRHRRPDGPAHDPRLTGQEHPLVVAGLPVEDAQALLGAGARHSLEAAEHRSGRRERRRPGRRRGRRGRRAPRGPRECRAATGPIASPGRMNLQRPCFVIGSLYG